MKLSFTIRGTITSNNRTSRRSSKVSRPYTPQAVKNERDLISFVIVAAMRSTKWQRVKWFKTRIRICNSRKDLDNSLKAVLDAMNTLCIEDDRYHLETHTSMWWDREGPRLEVEVEAADPVAYGRKPDRPGPGNADAAERRDRRVSRASTSPRAKAAARVVDHLGPLPGLSRTS
jgi:Holliday junction resolvase RusA-like endonuclease